MDIQAKIQEIIQKFKQDSSLLDKFKTNPVATIKELIGGEVEEDQLKQLVSGVTEKIGSEKSEGFVEEVKEKAAEFGENLSGFFHKKD